MRETPHGIHPRLGIPLYSLYSETRRPTAEMLGSIDGLLVDLQDVGTRVYTFRLDSFPLPRGLRRGTPAGCRARSSQPTWWRGRGRSAPRSGLLEFRRPGLNPDATRVDHRRAGTLGERRTRHRGCTAGCAHGGLATIHALPRDRPFVGPSVAEHAAFRDGPALSGTSPLGGHESLRGARHDDPVRDSRCAVYRPRSTARSTRGLFAARPSRAVVRFRPTFDKWQGTVCGGLFFQITAVRQVRSFQTTVAMLACVCALYPEDFAWLPPPYEYESRRMPVDIIYGGDALRRTLDCEPFVGGRYPQTGPRR